MHFQVGRSLHYYYVTLIVLTLGVFGAGAKYFWDNGPFNSENVSASYEASIQFDELQNRHPLEDIKNLVTTDRAREAIIKITSLEKAVHDLDSFGHVDSVENVDSSLVAVKKNLNELISYPQMTSVLSVLSNKIASYESYVSGNSWRTLTRISRRMKAYVTARNIQTPGFFAYKKLSRLHRTLSKEVSTMEKVTTGSVLSAGDKQNILTKLKTFDAEIKMLGEYVASLKNYNGSFKTLAEQYKIWLRDVAPEITLTRIKMEKDTKAMAFGLLGIAGLLFLGLMGGFLLNKRYSRRSSEALENNILKVIQDGLIPLENKLNFQGSLDFQREFERYREYFHKRISFGTVFQEAVPFSSVLLDSNLNVSWANDLFYQHWNLEDTHHNGGNISWDYLQQYTNLGEDDPVLMAHKQGIAGIYQIQVRNPHNSEILPYEMYVSPVEYSGQKRIMIFFYPLRSLEETMSQQTKSIVGPVSRALEAMTKGTFNAETKEKLHKDFDIAGISEVYDKFMAYNQVAKKAEDELITEIQNLEVSLEEQNRLIEDLEAFSVRKENLADNIKSDFENSKNAIIHNIDLRFELEGLFNKLHTVSNSLLKQDVNLLQGVENSNKVVEENFKAFQAVSKTKDEFKELKGNIDELRVRLNQSLEQSLMFMRKEGLDPKMEATITKVRMEMKGIEKVLNGFSTVLRNLDVGLGKMSLIIEQVDQYDTGAISEAITQAKTSLDDYLFEYGRIARTGQKTDDLVVDSLKGMFDSFMLMGQFDRNCANMIDHFREEELSQNVIFTTDAELENSLNQENKTESLPEV